jgi:hypothetical protein
VTLSERTVTAVSLARGMCEGPCPVYKVRLSTDGQVTYEGEYYVERMGVHRGRVAPESVQGLVRFILRLGFADLDSEYPTERTCGSTDELTLWRGERPSRVVDHGSAPPELWAMAALVDAVVDGVDWERPADRDDDEVVERAPRHGPAVEEVDLGRARSEPERWRLGYVEVDSGTLLIGDPAYLRADREAASEIDAALAPDAFAASVLRDTTLLLGNFGGDGRYPVIGEFDEAGVLASVTVEFVDPWDAESDEDDDG